MFWIIWDAIKIKYNSTCQQHTGEMPPDNYLSKWWQLFQSLSIFGYLILMKSMKQTIGFVRVYILKSCFCYVRWLTSTQDKFGYQFSHEFRAASYYIKLKPIRFSFQFNADISFYEKIWAVTIQNTTARPQWTVLMMPSSPTSLGK